MKKILDFCLKSSADPKRTSLTIKMALLGIIPYAMQAFGWVCEIGQTCLDIDQNLLERLVSGISETVFLLLSLVSVIGIVYGLFRKILTTMEGDNKAL